MNVTVIVALIAAIAAIIAPLITAQIQREAMREARQIDIFYKDKADVYKDFAVSFGKLNQNIYLEPLNEFLSCTYRAILFANKASRIEIANLIQLADSEHVDYADLKEQFSICIDLLNYDLRKSKVYSE